MAGFFKRLFNKIKGKKPEEEETQEASETVAVERLAVEPKVAQELELKPEPEPVPEPKA